MTTHGADGVTKITHPNGTVVTATLGPDPRWGMRAPQPASVIATTPGGRRRVATHERAVDLKQASDPFSVETITDETTVNGKTTSASTTAQARKLEVTSDEGRKLTTTYDAKGRPLTQGYGPGIAPRQYAWDTLGRLAKVVQGTPRAHVRLRRGQAAAAGCHWTDGENHTTLYGHDNAAARHLREDGPAARRTASPTTTSATARRSRCRTARRTRTAPRRRPAR